MSERTEVQFVYHATQMQIWGGTRIGNGPAKGRLAYLHEEGLLSYNGENIPFRIPDEEYQKYTSGKTSWNFYAYVPTTLVNKMKKALGLNR